MTTKRSCLVKNLMDLSKRFGNCTGTSHLRIQTDLFMKLIFRLFPEEIQDIIQSSETVLWMMITNGALYDNAKTMDDFSIRIRTWILFMKTKLGVLLTCRQDWNWPRLWIHCLTSKLCIGDAIYPRTIYENFGGTIGHDAFSLTASPISHNPITPYQHSPHPSGARNSYRWCDLCICKCRGGSREEATSKWEGLRTSQWWTNEDRKGIKRGSNECQVTDSFEQHFGVL